MCNILITLNFQTKSQLRFKLKKETQEVTIPKTLISLFNLPILKSLEQQKNLINASFTCSDSLASSLNCAGAGAGVIVIVHFGDLCLHVKFISTVKMAELLLVLSELRNVIFKIYSFQLRVMFSSYCLLHINVYQYYQIKVKKHLKVIFFAPLSEALLCLVFHSFSFRFLQVNSKDRLRKVLWEEHGNLASKRAT